MGYRLWVMAANQLGKSEKVCLMREYGLYLVWVRRISTVHQIELLRLFMDA